MEKQRNVFTWQIRLRCKYTGRERWLGTVHATRSEADAEAETICTKCNSVDVVCCGGMESRYEMMQQYLSHSKKDNNYENSN